MLNHSTEILGVLESKRDPIRKKLVRRLLEEQDKVLRSYFAQKGGARSQGRERVHGKGRAHAHGTCGTCMREDSARRSWPSDQLSLQWGAWKSGVFCLSIIFCGLV